MRRDRCQIRKHRITGQPSTQLRHLTSVRLSLAFALLLLCGSYSPTVAQEANGTTPTSTASTVVDDAAKMETRDLSFDDLKFEVPVGEDFESSMLTDAVKQLDGQKVKIRGYIKPNFQQRGFSKFVLVRDNQECCFGPGAAIYDCVLVMLDENVTTDFTVRPVTVEGMMYLKEYIGPDGKIWAIFRMKESRVE